MPVPKNGRTMDGCCDSQQDSRVGSGLQHFCDFHGKVIITNQVVWDGAKGQRHKIFVPEFELQKFWSVSSPRPPGTPRVRTRGADEGGQWTRGTAFAHHPKPHGDSDNTHTPTPTPTHPHTHTHTHTHAHTHTHDQRNTQAALKAQRHKFSSSAVSTQKHVQTPHQAPF